MSFYLRCSFLIVFLLIHSNSFSQEDITKNKTLKKSEQIDSRQPSENSQKPKPTNTHKEKQERSSRTPDSEAETENELRETLLLIKSQLNNLPRICSEQKTLHEKTIQFQRKMDQIKALSLAAREFILTHEIHFKRPVRQIFSVNVFYFYIFENTSFDYRQVFSTKENILLQQLQNLSLTFQHAHKTSFNLPEDTRVEEYSELARDIAITLKCLSSV